MKKFLFLTLFCAGFVAANAQLNDASPAPDFTVYEINKSNGTIISDNPYNLYTLLDSGKVVYLDFFATWCAPCWNFHNHGYFESLYSQYGPEGTNEVMTFGIEASYGNYASLSGTGPDNGGQATQGNWLAGVLYPIIPTTMSPNTQAIANSFSIAYYPTVYVVCPHRLVYEIGQKTDNELYAAKTNVCSPYDPTVQTNGLIAKYSVDDEIGGINYNYLCEATATPKVYLQNVGDNTLTSAEFEITFNGQTTTFPWTGSLQKYAKATVTLPQIHVQGHGTYDYTVKLVSTNGTAEVDTASNSRTLSFFVNAEATSENVMETFSNGIQTPWYQDDNNNLDVHNGAVYFYAWGISSGGTGTLFSPIFDVSRFQVPVLKFDIAHKRYSASAKERLQVMASTNCGSSWTTLYNVVDPDLATVSGYATSGAYIPGNNDWRTEVIDLSGLADKTNVALKFKFTSGYGNLVWIDNITISEGVGIEDQEVESLSIYPNPVSDMLYVSAPEMVSEVQIFNLQGQLVRSLQGDIHEISVSDLSDGVYMMKVRTESGSTTTQKIVKQ